MIFNSDGRFVDCQRKSWKRQRTAIGHD